MGKKIRGQPDARVCTAADIKKDEARALALLVERRCKAERKIDEAYEYLKTQFPVVDMELIKNGHYPQILVYTRGVIMGERDHAKVFWELDKQPHWLVYLGGRNNERKPCWDLEEVAAIIHESDILVPLWAKDFKPNTWEEEILLKELRLSGYHVIPGYSLIESGRGYVQLEFRDTGISRLWHVRRFMGQKALIHYAFVDSSEAIECIMELLE